MEEENNNGVAMARFSLLPEGFISDFLSLTSPPDACRAAVISSEFKSAVDSDAVWERFLPPDYREIIARSATPVVYATKKQLYFRLCDSPILLDGGKMSFMLNKWSGKKCYLLPASELGITWGGTPQYWNWGFLPESRFSEVAELVAVCWLDIRGRMGTRMLSQNTTYAAFLVFKLRENSEGLDCPMKALVRLVGESEEVAEDEASTVYLKPQPNGWLPRTRMDGWMEIELGQFFNDEGDDGAVDIRFREIQQLHWKSGLIVEGIELRPKSEAHID